jgi:hypothetical protein
MYGVWVYGKECDGFIERKQLLPIDKYIIIYHPKNIPHDSKIAKMDKTQKPTKRDL